MPEAQQTWLMEALVRIRKIAEGIGCDDQQLETEPIGGDKSKFTLQKKADMMLAKLVLLETFPQMLSEVATIARTSNFKPANLFESKI